MNVRAEIRRMSDMSIIKSIRAEKEQIKSIRAKKAQLYKAMHQLESWANGEDTRWRNVAILDYDAAITALHAAQVEAVGENFANTWCGAIDETVKARYHFDEEDVAAAKLMDYSFLRGV